MNPAQKLSISLYSDPNFLAVNLLENLISKGCVVNIVTDDTDGWIKLTSNLSVKNRFSFISRKDIGTNLKIDYSIFCGGFINTKKAFSDLIDFNSNPILIKSKTLIIMPTEAFNREELDRIKLNDKLLVLFLGDILGPRMDLESNLLMAKTILEVARKKEMTLGVGEVFYPIFVSDVVKVITKWLFSFGPYGKEILLLGNQVSGDKFWSESRNILGEIKLKYDDKKNARVIPRGIPTEIINNNIKFSLIETYKWISNNWSNYLDKQKSSRRVVTRNGKLYKIPKNVKTIITLTLLALLFPFIVLLGSLATSFIGYKCFVSGRDETSKNLFLLSRTFSVIAQKESRILSYIPGVGLIYKETVLASRFVNIGNNLGVHLIPAVRDASGLFGNILGDSVYDLKSISLRISSETSTLNNDLVELKNTNDSGLKTGVKLARMVSESVDLDKLIRLSQQGQILVNKLPEMLGLNQPKTYLVLFQNNMELRPTGGFIGSYGLITFDKGRLSSFDVSDVYSADGQLNGHVEPPLPIKNYLGEANWWLRDSNWDPDFPTSAKRAEWFLDKEVGRKVDGVIGVDLSPIRDILKSTGPIFLSDYNLDITSDNLYEKTQEEVQSDFFPGTHKKASFLTALSRNLLNGLTKLDASQKMSIIKSLYSAFDGRHIQAYLHDNDVQTAIGSLIWDGSVFIPTCGDGCYGDMVGLVEANVGVNKANYFIERSVDLEVKKGPYEINRELTLNLKNNANTTLGLAGKYKAYVRLMVPQDSNILNVVEVSGQNQESLSPEITELKGRKEVGVLVELLGTQSKSLVFSWKTASNLNSPITGYGLYIRKQAGVESYPITINIDTGNTTPQVDSILSLTGAGGYLYNTTLVRDLYSRFNW